jgi:hypothetical protein
MKLNLPNTSSGVLLEIKRLSNKKELLETIFRYTKFSNVKILFTANDQPVILDADMLPFHLPTELFNLLEDSIDQYDKDLETLKFHLKNI